MTMTNDVLEQLNYLKLKSAYSYLNSLVMNNEIAEKELHVMHKILNKEVIAKEWTFLVAQAVMNPPAM